MRSAWVLAVAASSALGCATVVKPPPVTAYELGTSRANYRAYQKQSALCAAEPRWLFDELASVNSLLDRFVDDTFPRRDGSLSDVQMMKLEQAMATLPDVLDAHEKNLALLSGCPFADQRGFPILAKKGKRYARDARRRLEDAPAKLAEVKLQRALEEWRDRVGREKVTLQLGCPKKSRSPIIYFAWQDEQGVTTWLFCDGSRVVAEGRGDPWFDPSPLLTERQKKRLKTSRWLDAAKRHPSAGVMQPPTGPATATKDSW